MPFYASYAAFYRAMHALQQQGIPRRITTRQFAQLKDDASRVVAGFTSIGLIDDDGTPSSELRQLVRAFGTSSWPSLIRGLVQRAYSFVPATLDEMTRPQLHEVFVSHLGRDAESMRNVETFFLCLAAEAGLPMSEPLMRGADRGVGDAKRWLLLSNIESGSVKESDAPTDFAPASETTNTNVNRNVNRTARFADQIVKLTSLLSEGDMTDDEKRAVITVLSYLGRQMNAA
jgi:hypothetical protein